MPLTVVIWSKYEWLFAQTPAAWIPPTSAINWQVRSLVLDWPLQFADTHNRNRDFGRYFLR